MKNQTLSKRYNDVLLNFVSSLFKKCLGNNNFVYIIPSICIDVEHLVV